MANSGYKGISRVKRTKRHAPGWQTRVVFRGELHQKFFPNSDYRTARDALRAAIRWRNATEKWLGKPRTERVVVGLSRRNKTGVIGIYLAYKRSQRPGRGGRKSKVYVITWKPEPDIVRRTSVSITKYGPKEALHRAIQIREQAELEMYGATLPRPKPRRR